MKVKKKKKSSVWFQVKHRNCQLYKHFSPVRVVCGHFGGIIIIQTLPSVSSTSQLVVQVFPARTCIFWHLSAEPPGKTQLFSI